MRVAVNGFGSIWTRRFGKNPLSRRRFLTDAAFFNTTGVDVGGRLRARPLVYGVARFDGASGFMPHGPEGMLNRVFDCEPPCEWNGGMRLLFRALLPRPQRPEGYLVVLRELNNGRIDHESAWRSFDVTLISFSETQMHQEVMLLMPPFSWVRTAFGLFILQPHAGHTSVAHLVRASRG
jgi:hypothetical protein